ncbi:HPr family phosphocarrier protein [Pseudarthrobacter sp. NamE5]|uniref:HPr family phosphocarrier protein n=1 Tax=Pseudarthrobacter sp. NamE5 TaxID=2576839 RepID=UPI00110ACCF6|nr:HPr family phosphocarrier protein [Pseudarthrobacter sp. NamE5]TLM87614.1 HPr family phosphocarrier protein [Pseudarthrobacter sp. NamE5]
MPTHKAVVTAAIGLHARPAAIFVRAVNETGLPVTITKEGSAGVDARSLLQVMTADFPQGCEVELGISETALDGRLSREKAKEALRTLGELLESQGTV